MAYPSKIKRPELRVSNGNSRRLTRNYCVQKYADGSVYEGFVQAHSRSGCRLREGNGALFFGRNSVYAGQWKNDKFDGRGLLLLDGVERYEGRWTAGRKNGLGVLVSREHGVFIGAFADNLRHGRGVHIQRDGAAYAQEWTNGKCISSRSLAQILYAERNQRRFACLLFRDAPLPRVLSRVSTTTGSASTFYSSTGGSRSCFVDAANWDEKRESLQVARADADVELPPRTHLSFKLAGADETSAQRQFFVRSATFHDYSNIAFFGTSAGIEFEPGEPRTCIVTGRPNGVEKQGHLNTHGRRATFSFNKADTRFAMRSVDADNDRSRRIVKQNTFGRAEISVKPPKNSFPTTMSRYDVATKDDGNDTFRNSTAEVEGLDGMRQRARGEEGRQRSDQILEKSSVITPLGNQTPPQPHNWRRIGAPDVGALFPADKADTTAQMEAAAPPQVSSSAGPSAVNYATSGPSEPAHRFPAAAQFAVAGPAALFPLKEGVPVDAAVAAAAPVRGVLRAEREILCPQARKISYCSASAFASAQTVAQRQSWSSQHLLGRSARIVPCSYGSRFYSGCETESADRRSISSRPDVGEDVEKSVCSTAIAAPPCSALVLPAINDWSAADVGVIVERAGLTGLKPLFESQGVTGSQLLRLSEEQLRSASFNITDPTERQVILRLVQLLLQSETFRRLRPFPQRGLIQHLRHLFHDWLIPAAALKRRHLIGSGAYGAVFEGVWNGRMRVAIKCFYPPAKPARTAVAGVNGERKTSGSSETGRGHPAPGLEILLNLAKEVRALMRLQHANLAKLWGVCITETRQWIVTSLAAGGSLSDRLRGRCGGGGRGRHGDGRCGSPLLHQRHLIRAGHPKPTERSGGGGTRTADYSSRRSACGGPLPLADICAIARDVCDGMAYLHDEVGLLHCDLKSANVLLTADEGEGTVQGARAAGGADTARSPGGKPASLPAHRKPVALVCDFGLAVSACAPAASLRMRFGTIQWMAPEVLRGAEVSKASDVYSFGVLLWEMLTGKLPHEDLLPNFAIARVGWLAQPRLTLPLSVPRQLTNVLRRCLHEDDGARPSFRALAREFATLEKVTRSTGSQRSIRGRMAAGIRHAYNAIDRVLFGPTTFSPSTTLLPVGIGPMPSSTADH